MHTHRAQPSQKKLSVSVSPWLINHCVLALLIGVGAAASPSAAIKNTCDLITKSEMEAALGTPMRAPEPQIMGMCEYRSVGDHPYKAVRLMLGHAESRQEWEQHEWQQHQAAPALEPEQAEYSEYPSDPDYPVYPAYPGAEGS